MFHFQEKSTAESIRFECKSTVDLLRGSTRKKIYEFVWLGCFDEFDTVRSGNGISFSFLSEQKTRIVARVFVSLLLVFLRYDEETRANSSAPLFQPAPSSHGPRNTVLWPSIPEFLRDAESVFPS